MRLQRRLLVAGTVALIVALVVLFPARVAWHWFAPPGMALAGIDGSIWIGSAREASANGLYLRDISWRWLPAGLLTGRWAYRMKAVPGSGFVNADIGVSPGGTVYVDGLRASVPLPALESAFGVPGIQGTADVDMTALRLAGGVPVAADGTIEISGLVVPLVAPSPLGRYRAEVQTREEAIVASVHDDGAVVDLAGRLQIGPERDYDFLGYVAPTESTPPPLLQQLRYLGTPNDRGQYELRLSGRL